MAKFKFFISYSHSVRNEVRNLVGLLIDSGHEVWWDQLIPVSADWWAAILDHIEWCDVFIFVASEKSVVSAACLAEIKYASDRQRPIIPLMLDAPETLTLPTMLVREQWLIYNGDPTQMLAQINNACENIDWKQHRDIKVRRPPEPLTDGKSVATQFQAARRLANEKRFDEAKAIFANVKRLDFDEWGTECDEWLGRLNSYEPLMELVDDESTQARARTAWGIHRREYGKGFDPHAIEEKLKGSPAPRSRMIVAGFLVVGALIIGVMIALSNSNNGGNPPLTPTHTHDGVSIAQGDTETPTPTTDPLRVLTHNPNWTPAEREFDDGVTMVLVPVGCFMMGSTQAQVDELIAAGMSNENANSQLPQHEQCFDAPFWIDKTEVTQGDFARLGGVQTMASYFSGENRPVERIYWSEARDFCALRGGRLPTEAEWEYAARGVESWAYPWGNTWNANNAIWYQNSSQGTATVGSLPAGKSWVGALDMSGNVREWTNSLFESYPYRVDDGREVDIGIRTDVPLSSRGGGLGSDTDYLRAAYRSWGFPTVTDSSFGFRCARDFE